MKIIIKNIKEFAVFFILALGVLPAHSQEKSRILEAASVARAQIASELAKTKKFDGDMSNYVSNIDNYDIGLSESRDYYVVAFNPRDKRVRGSRFYCWIRKRDLTVAKWRGQE